MGRFVWKNDSDGDAERTTVEQFDAADRCVFFSLLFRQQENVFILFYFIFKERNPTGSAEDHVTTGTICTDLQPAIDLQPLYSAAR